ncbi:pectate lyase family protein [Luteimonas salinilitoris]|uniref:Polysaccharide lyase family 1 protein n=1 Tax=Luteimonas salinilitoris TaxID=3237697 RepID=A0ABV4HY03_9GAMM
MNRIRTACLSLLLLPLAANATDLSSLEREAIAPGDGWASAATEALPLGTTGGSAADVARVHTVHDRNALVAALGHPDATPKIIRVAGVIDANVDADGNPLACEDYARPDPETGELYSLEQYLADYDPAVWGRDSEPEGPQERARRASASAQQSRIRIRIPSNTTIVGVGPDAAIRGAWFDIRPGSGSDNAPANVIIRNLTFADTHDCFPQWDPTDGSAGNWNSLYDAISIRNATHVWIDHNTLLDDATADDTLPHYFGRLFQVHDGLIDITNASDLVTVSWNVLADHDKAMLVGSSDGASADRGRLRITLHHNLFHDLAQRVPRLRFGQAHVYNNLYSLSSEGAGRYGYSWGLGIESQLYAENNAFLVPPDVTPDRFIGIFNGTAAHVAGTYVNGVSRHNAVDVIAAYNAANGTAIGSEVDWTPTLFKRIDPTQSVPARVSVHAGPLE